MTAKSISKICSVDGCELPLRYTGYCNAHYLRLRRRGTLDLTRKLLTENDQSLFWSHVDKPDADACWNWQLAKDKDGYGVSKFNGKKIAAHRLSFYFATGKLSELWILHKCDNPSCVNPKHLYEGTNRENVRDRTERNPYQLGENNNRAKLTADKVRQARLLHQEGCRFSDLARQFGVVKGVIRAAILRETWRHVT